MVAFCINTADCFWLWINLFTAHSHGCLLYGSYTALLYGMHQIYNSGLEFRDFHSGMGFPFFFPQWWVWWELKERGGVRGDLPHFLWCWHSCGLAPPHWPLTSLSLLCMDCWHSLLFLAVSKAARTALLMGRLGQVQVQTGLGPVAFTASATHHL